jgi:S-sulfo-L-cysteine synthase (O-acetyl-L-serine-dependent)
MSRQTHISAFTATQQTSVARSFLDQSSLLSAIGHTPLLRIRNVAVPNIHVRVYAKAEWLNPGGSIKDRPALNMLLEAERSGELTRGKIIIDASSGNTGIAYAMLGSALGYQVHIALPANASAERKQVLRAFGAALIETDPLTGTDGAQQYVRELVRESSGQYYYPDQYNNPANWQAHYYSTAWEIWNQTRQQVTHFVAGLGTTGTFVGISRRLKELNPSIRCISCGPDGPIHGLEGLKHLPTALVPGIYDQSVADEHVTITTEEAHARTRELGRHEGLYVGISSGAALAVSLRLAARIDSGMIVTIFPDGGSRYGSDQFWNTNG